MRQATLIFRDSPISVFSVSVLRTSSRMLQVAFKNQGIKTANMDIDQSALKTGVNRCLHWHSEYQMMDWCRNIVRRSALVIGCKNKSAVWHQITEHRGRTTCPFPVYIKLNSSASWIQNFLLDEVSENDITRDSVISSLGSCPSLSLGQTETNK
jgi:hypothetical protein